MVKRRLYPLLQGVISEKEALVIVMIKILMDHIFFMHIVCQRYFVTLIDEMQNGT